MVENDFSNSSNLDGSVNVDAQLPSDIERQKLIEEQRQRYEIEQRKISLGIKKFINSVLYSFFILLVTFLSIVFSFNENVWFLERAFAMVAYFLFFVTIVIGILRKFGTRFIYLVRYHKPTGVWAFMFVLAHIIAVIFDNYKYGFQLSLATYFGLDYSSQWLWPASIGALAFWIFLIVVISSVGKNIGRLGRGLWKKIHYTSYVGFILMNVHAFYLGTDFKSMSYSAFVYWISWVMIIIVTILFVLRVIYGIRKK